MQVFNQVNKKLTHEILGSRVISWYLDIWGSQTKQNPGNQSSQIISSLGRLSGDPLIIFYTLYLFSLFENYISFSFNRSLKLTPASQLIGFLPDIVILDKQKQEVIVYELTIPEESCIRISYNLKYEKYQRLVSDIRDLTVNIVPFEIGSSTGYVSYENKSHLKSLNKFCQKNINCKNSYGIFLHWVYSLLN